LWCPCCHCLWLEIEDDDGWRKRKWGPLKEKKVRSRRESVGAGILFWQQRGKSRGGGGDCIIPG
jgi:hypothetical protein